MGDALFRAIGSCCSRRPTLSESRSQSGYRRNPDIATEIIEQAASMANTIPTIAGKDLDPERFRVEHVLPGMPLLIRGAVLPDQIFSLTEFRHDMGEQEVFVCEHGKERGPKWQWSRYAYQYPLRVEEYMKMIKDGRAAARDIYMSFLKIGSIESTGRISRFFDDFASR